MRTFWLSLVGTWAIVLGLSGCASFPETGTPVAERPTAVVNTRTPPPKQTAPRAVLTATPRLVAPAVYGFTYQQPTGNRVVAGYGTFPDEVQVLDIPLNDTPSWLVAVPVEDGGIWVTVSENGEVQAFEVVDATAKPLDIEPHQITPGAPPLLRVKDGVPALITPPTPRASSLTHPIVLPGSGRLAFIEVDGDLVIWDNGEVARLAVNALLDARILVDEAGRLLLLTDATDARYTHGVLGDRIEAASITLIETTPIPRVAMTIALPEPQVVEGIAPIWADLNGDGRREIIVTVSDARQGAQVVAFTETGERFAAGPPIGRGSRWRHQLAVAPFGPEGEMELADVLTPHIGGVAEFYRLEGQTLRIVATMSGYSSHALGSRNLDMAVAGDFDGDGHGELLVPNQARNELGGIRHTSAGAEVAWRLLIGGHLSTNLVTVRLPDGRLAVGAGRSDGVLRIWLPERS